MPTTLTTPAIEESTYGIPFTFMDDAGVAVTPSAAVWTLLKKVGEGASAVETIVNSRLNVPITPLATTAMIVLSGDDLALVIGEGNPKTRYLLVEYIYSSSLGSNLPGKDQVTFPIVNLVGVPE